jgi:hypothetical protein
MGANAQTSVPAFTAGQVLTAAQVTQINTGIPVFASSTERDAAFGGTGEKTLAEGQFAYLEDTDTVQVYNGTAWQTVGASSVKKIEAFTASGTWTVPTGVTYAIAHIRGGGGGCAFGSTNGGTGGTSSVAFSGGTVSAAGGNGLCSTYSGGTDRSADGAANSGQGGRVAHLLGYAMGASAGDGAYIVAADTVTPAASITVTVGAGGTAASGAVGGTGYVWIEYYEPA